MRQVYLDGDMISSDGASVGSRVPSSSAYDARATSLGATLRLWRDRLSPEQAGLQANWSRRVSGLRREELAQLAGLSVDYIIRLEQGRAKAPSPVVVAALASALRLDRAERDHLYGLAGLQPPGDRRITDRLSPGVRRILARLEENAVAVFAADWQLVWWNTAWAALLGDPSSVPPAQRNVVAARFPTPSCSGRLDAWPVRSSDPEATDRTIVADLRRAIARYPDDPRLIDLLHRTIAGNPRFADLWSEGAVGERVEDRKTIEHPVVGDVTVDCDVLSAGENDLKIVLLTASAGSDDARKIEHLRTATTIDASLEIDPIDKD